MTANHPLKDLRKALGRFTTGICIAATRKPDGSPVGLTINSFNSVSLDPPLVLWSIAGHAMSAPVFSEAEGFAISVLGADQRQVADRFAGPGDRFAFDDWAFGDHGAPFIRRAIAVFECRTVFQYEGGDHTIHVGEVLKHWTRPGAPLIYMDGQYGRAYPAGKVAC
ncbi:flavin oxidoreductase [Roseibium aquae]|uniref:Flavin oxidoreductase n=1 Tax=Roseibium aquae TaxID=1323746 RepID=A0A916T8D1_9HYPH|nr:flavin reductase family protein [Roseibium aquae]GGB34067.1 flavin oxidoreductase [Roseibium aquae]